MIVKIMQKLTEPSVKHEFEVLASTRSAMLPPGLFLKRNLPGFSFTTNTVFCFVLMERNGE